MSDNPTPPEPVGDWRAWSAEMHARLHPTPPGDVEQVRAHFNAAGTFTRYDHAEMRVVFDALDSARAELATYRERNDPFPGMSVTPYEITLTDTYGHSKTVTIQYEDDEVRWYIDDDDRETHYFFKHQWAKDEAERAAALDRLTRDDGGR